MKCTTIRDGHECAFMTAKGCSYNDGICHEIIERCNGCARIITIENGTYCTAAPDPSLKWKFDHCNLATHVKIEEIKENGKLNPIKASKRLNPIKASKRGNR